MHAKKKAPGRKRLWILWWAENLWRLGTNDAPVEDADVIDAEAITKEAMEKEDAMRFPTGDAHADMLRSCGLRVDNLVALKRILDI